MNTSVTVVMASMLSRRLFTRPFHRVRQIQKSFFATSSGDGSTDSPDEAANSPVERLSFADSLKKARDNATSMKTHTASGKTPDSSSSSSSDSSDSSDEDNLLHGKHDAADFTISKSAKLRITNQDMFKTSQSDPSNHTMDLEGLYYTVSPEDQKMYLPNFINPFLKEQAGVFGELSLMIRKPALEIIDILKNSNYSCPLPKFVIYGQRGAGKTCTLNHVMHYCGKQNHMLLHIPWVNDWIRYHTSSTPSISKAGFTNLPEQAKNWISYFAAINAPLIKDMKVTKSIDWTKKEVTEAGSPLQSLIDFGLMRLKYSDDVVDALLDEVMIHAADNKFKVLIAIDGLNGFFRPTTLREPLERQIFIRAQKLRLVDSFKRLLRSGSKNVVAVCTVSEEIHTDNEREKFTPFYLLGKEAFQELEPIIPILVENYSDREVQSCLDLYQDKQWLQNPAARTDAGHQQIKFLTNNNPYAISKLCGAN